MADQSNPANAQSPEGRSDEAAERSSVNAPREHGPPQRADPPAATAADDETPAKSRPPADSPALQPGNPLFKTPFSDEADSKRSTLAPYFQIMDRFQALAEEYPDVSAVWQAEFGRWRAWPLPFRDAKILSEHISRSEEYPTRPVPICTSTTTLLALSIG
jgi:hypothetical protein